MNRSIEAFSVIASDIGIKRFAGEKEESFCRRTAYSAARFWLSAFCMDDGASGTSGITKQAMNRRLKGWISSLAQIQPGLAKWFDADGKGISTIYNRLIDLGDLAPNGFDNSYVATPPMRVELSEDFSCIAGFFDPTALGVEVCGYKTNSLLISGLLVFVRSKNKKVLQSHSWWIRDLEYLDWKKASDYGEIKFADTRTRRWNISLPEVWTDIPFWVDNLTLAKSDSNGLGSLFFVVTRVCDRVYLSPISWIQAQELFFYLRQENGNKVVAKYSMLDSLHARATIPIGFIPGDANRILDAIGWPVESAVDRFNRIIRDEAIPLVEELLSTSYVGLERVSDGR